MQKGSSFSGSEQGAGPMPKMAEIRYTMPPDNDYSVLSIILVDNKGRSEIYNNPHLEGILFLVRLSITERLRSHSLSMDRKWKG